MRPVPIYYLSRSRAGGQQLRDGGVQMSRRVWKLRAQDVLAPAASVPRRRRPPAAQIRHGVPGNVQPPRHLARPPAAAAQRPPPDRCRRRSDRTVAVAITIFFSSTHRPHAIHRCGTRPFAGRRTNSTYSVTHKCVCVYVCD